MASTNEIVLISVISCWLIISLPLAACSGPGFGVGEDRRNRTQAQDVEKGSSTGEAAILGARPVPSAPNPFHHHGFSIPTPPPPSPSTPSESEP